MWRRQVLFPPMLSLPMGIQQPASPRPRTRSSNPVPSSGESTNFRFPVTSASRLPDAPRPGADISRATRFLARLGRPMTRPAANSTRRKGTVRCAIYCRKSSEEGLEQAFNSLQAQREACEAFIISQRHEGWACDPSAREARRCRVARPLWAGLGAGRNGGGKDQALPVRGLR